MIILFIPCKLLSLFLLGGGERRGETDRATRSGGGGVDPLRSSGTAGRGCLPQVTVSLVGINLRGTSTQQLCVCVCVCVMAMVRAVRGAGEQWEITLTGPVLYIILGADAIHECWLDSTGGLITFCLDAVGVCGLSLTGAVCTVFKKMENFSLFFGQKITF